MKHLFTIKRRQSNNSDTLAEDTAFLISMMIASNPQACKCDEIPQGFGKFGLTVTNPIPVYGISGSGHYLSNLRLTNGAKINWEREGSVSADNISEPIDKYKILTRKGEKITYLYISPYHLKTSKKAPEDFKILK